MLREKRELFVLDMGEPIKILDLAENMIRLSGQSDIEIIETGLRPGEKLYEELLIKTEEMDKTSNELIFIERDKPIGQDAIDKKLRILRDAVNSGSNEEVKTALATVVPTYVQPNKVITYPNANLGRRACACIRKTILSLLRVKYGLQAPQCMGKKLNT